LEDRKKYGKLIYNTTSIRKTDNVSENRQQGRWEENIKWDFKNRMRGYKLDLSHSGFMSGTCEHCNEPQGSIKQRYMLE